MDTQWKLAQAKQRVDSMIGLPGVMLRKGVARSGNSITGITDYNWKLLRDDERRFLYYCEWVDPDGEGHRVVLPHEAVVSLFRGRDSIMQQARKQRSSKAVQTRQEKAAANVIAEAKEVVDSI